MTSFAARKIPANRDRDDEGKMVTQSVIWIEHQGREAVKGAIASVEVFAHRRDEPVQRLSLVIGAPTPTPTSTPGEGGWKCRVALANLKRSEEITGRDSVEALAGALLRSREWLAALRAEGFVLYRDRAGSEPYRLD